MRLFLPQYSDFRLSSRLYALCIDKYMRYFTDIKWTLTIMRFSDEYESNRSRPWYSPVPII